MTGTHRPRRHALRGAFAGFVALGLTVLVPTAAAAAPESVSSKAPPSTPEERARTLTEPATVYLEVSWKTWVNTHADSDVLGTYLGPFSFTMRCSGFIVNPSGYVATAGHCVDPGVNGALPTAIGKAVAGLVADGLVTNSNAAINRVVNHALGYWTLEGSIAGSAPERTIRVQHGVAVVGKKATEWGSARLIEFKPLEEGDVALLKVEASDLPVVTLATGAQIVTGTKVLSVGYPASSDSVTDKSLSPTFKDGEVNSTTKTREGGLLPVYEISAALSGGMSGGPTVDLNGDVVGINSYTIVGESQAFNFITPTSLVGEMLARNGVKNELGPVDKLYRDGLDAYYAGKYKTAIAKFQQVLDRVPSHQLAQQMKTKAVEQQALVKSSGSSLLPILLGVGGGLVLLGGGAFLVTRRRRTPNRRPVVVTGQPAMTLPIVEASPAPIAGALQAPPTGYPPEVPLAPTGEGEGMAFCSHCGTHVVADDMFCPHCGHRLHREPEHI